MQSPEQSPFGPDGYSLDLRLPPAEITRLRDVVSSAPFVRRVMDVMPNLVGALTDTRQLVLANQAMRDFLGAGEGDLLEGPRPGEAFGCVNAGIGKGGCGTSPQCQQCGAFQTILEAVTKRTHARGECRISYYSNHCVDNLELSLWCAPFMVEGHNFSLLAAVDISDEKRRSALERIFFHDVLNTSQSMLSYIQLLKLADGQEARELLEGLAVTADTLIEEILAQRDLMRAEHHELTLTPAPMTSEDLLRRAAGRYGPRAYLEQPPVELHPGREFLEFVSDPVILGRVLGNMVKNAVEAAVLDGGAVTLDARSAGDRVDLRVHNPQAMPLEVQHQVFQRSFSTKGPGRGLGTYSIRLLTERYLQGEVGFESAPETGTTFYVRLPKELKSAD